MVSNSLDTRHFEWCYWIDLTLNDLFITVHGYYAATVFENLCLRVDHSCAVFCDLTVASFNDLAVE